MACWEFGLEQEHRHRSCVAAHLRNRTLLSAEPILMTVFTHIHQEWGGRKGHMPHAAGRTGWHFVHTTAITSVTLQSNFPTRHTDVPLMCAFDPSDLPLHIRFYPDFYQKGESLIF